ncbi:MAG: HEPN domain-containing protein [Nitrospira sp.]|nr:HEPN domain-containing protein [Nitrospira sp.]MDH4371449.1 HEPN domain-containing protein [Nitrospira sp.]MDH5499164.1 HEPN domain-containing protein [Nitrospira sp.]MDH5727294.1 HEPN domain-containing protein [Nitrospira sp.]
MTESSRPEEVQAELLRADKSLAAARSLLKDDFLEDALSRAYYSILHAARAVLLAEGVSVSSHRAVRRLFGSHLIKPGKLAVRLAKILAEEQDDRFLADYDAWFHAERERAEKRVSEAAEFLAAIKLFLRSEGERQ